MQDLITMLHCLKRPRLLIRAARFGLPDYNRGRHLQRLLRTTGAISPARAIMGLMGEESVLEEKRKTGDASYSIARHIEVLVALMGEAQLLKASRAKVDA